jgi:hypothetical protein
MYAAIDRIEGPPDDLLVKVSAQNPQWTAPEWEVWWCKWGRKRWPHWKDLKICDACVCDRAVVSPHSTGRA